MIVGNFSDCCSLLDFYYKALDMYKNKYGEDFILYYKTIEQLSAMINSYKELGSMQGVSAAAAIIGNPKLSYVEMIDISFEHLQNHKHLFEYNKNVFFNKTNSITCSATYVDMTLIDSLHNYKHVIQEIKLHAPKTRKFLMFHDSNYHEIKRAISETVESGVWQYKTIDKRSFGYTVLERKIK